MYETKWWVYTNDGRKVGEFGVMFSGDEDADADYQLVAKTFELWCWSNGLDDAQHNYCAAGA